MHYCIVCSYKDNEVPTSDVVVVELFEVINDEISTSLEDCEVTQGRLNSLKVVGAQLTNKTHFYCEKLNSYEHL